MLLSATLGYKVVTGVRTASHKNMKEKVSKKQMIKRKRNLNQISDKAEFQNSEGARIGKLIQRTYPYTIHLSGKADRPLSAWIHPDGTTHYK